MDIFRKKRNESGIDQCRNYSRIISSDIQLHKITEQEYNAVPINKKNRLGIFLSIPGLLMILEALFFIFCMKDVIDEIKSHSDYGWLGLFIMPMVFLFLGVFTFIAIQEKFRRRVTKVSLVALGEVLETKVHYNNSRSRKYITDADHIVAIHGSNEIVVINDKKPIYAGSAVLIVKTRDLRYILTEIDKRKVRLDYNPAECETTKTYSSPNITYDYADYDQIHFHELKRNSISEYEYNELPEIYRSVAPLHRGFVSVFWMLFIIITCIMLIFLVIGFVQHSDEFLPLFVGFLCIAFLDWLLSALVLRIPLPFNQSYYVDCVVTYKANVSGHCYINAVFPEDKQYIERIEIEAEIFPDLVENVPVRLYFRDNYLIAQYIRII